MARYTGICTKCGDKAHPKGNVFRIMSSLYYEIDYGTDRLGGVATENVKVCNNCNTAHPFQRRVSAKAKARNEMFEWLIAEIEG